MEDGVVMIIRLFTQKAFINFGECWQYADWMVVFSRKGSSFLNIGVTRVILIWMGMFLWPASHWPYGKYALRYWGSCFNRLWWDCDNTSCFLGSIYIDYNAEATYTEVW